MKSLLCIYWCMRTEYLIIKRFFIGFEMSIFYINTSFININDKIFHIENSTDKEITVVRKSILIISPNWK